MVISMSKKIRCVKGYMTLEASFIIPWVIFLFVFLIYASFYFYNKCVLFQDVYAVCFRGSIQKQEGGASEYINAHMAEQFGKKYFGTGTVSGSVEQTGQEVKAYGTCSIKVPFGHFLTMAKKEGWRIQTEARAQVVNPTKVIRKCRMAGNIIEKLQD